jgi:hypothetical protein
MPEPLESRMQVSAAMLINLIARGGDVFANARALLTENHEPPHRQRELVRRALGIAKTLVRAGVVVIDRAVEPATITLTVDLQPNFALNQPLSPFALAVIGVLDHTGADYPLDVISVIESTLDNPRPVLAQQQFAARGEAIGAMKAEGLDYDERMEALDEVEYPKPLDELLTAMFETFASTQPWIRDVELRPKSVVRDLFEKAMTFTEYVSHYKLTRSEGLLLRYLSDADRAIRQTVPDEAKTDELRDIIEWLRELVRQVDSSLQDEWEQLSNPAAAPSDEAVLPPRPPDVTTNRRAFLVLVRNELFRRVQLMALQRDDDLEALDPDAGWPEALDAYYDDHDEVLTGGNARSASLVQIDTAPVDGGSTDAPGTWHVRQVIDDPAGDHDWGIDATVDLAASVEAGFAVVSVLGLRRL